MKINMQIDLTQDDIAAAIRAYLRSEIPLSEEQDIQLTIVIDDREGVSASAIVTNGDAVVKDTKPTAPANTGVRERGKPSPGRMRRTQAEIAEDEAADRADTEAAAAATSAGNQESTTAIKINDEIPIQTPATETPADDEPPFDVDSKSVLSDAQTNAVTESAPAKPAGVFSIFPSAESSAPALPKVETPPVPVGAKSLFANLGTPTQAAG